MERACAATSALVDGDLRGLSLPMKTLALTFDDGPGARTAELSAYLKSEGIRAAFFVNGKNVTNPAQLATLAADGHLVANHTQSHRSITGRSTGTPRETDAELLAEIGQTDALVAPLAGGRLLFRAPYGDFDAKAAAVVDGSPLQSYVGDVGWDIGDHMGAAQAADWDCWSPGADGKVLSPQACADLYAKEIDAVGHGIVLMHDPYFIGNDPQKGGTVDMVKILVPVLKQRGYAFARVDAVPDIAALLPPLADDAGSLSSTPDHDGGTSVSPQTPNAPPAKGTGSDASGGKPEPCPPSPHETAAK